ncbi:MAG: GNAT family N-acetyltransferase [Prevotella sp.]|nr:GNAT family N-acetyltransferase [Bacteroides sp.]MCM1365775.1 GNAT family N-acetyltransferase [Prevotella sp.]MCM1436533.1 GNAT family N-acetyltransferase [Prevotella sp.]
MNVEKVKSEMKKLWRLTFHDSDEYINLVFDTYFHPKFVEYVEKNNEIVSALLAVPYNFERLIWDEQDDKYSIGKLKGLYLCGLATKTEFRNRGYIKTLIERVNKKAYDLNYDFTFLIPAEDRLHDFYLRQKYVDCFRRVEDRYIKGYDFIGKYNVGEILKINKISGSNVVFEYGEYVVKSINNILDGLNEKLLDFYEYKRLSEKYFELKHSVKDFNAVLNENYISGGSVVSIFNKNRVCVGFLLFNINDNNECIIPHLYCNNELEKNLLLQGVSILYPEYDILLYTYPDDISRESLRSQFINLNYTENDIDDIRPDVETVYNVACHPINYGMGRILHVYEILKFADNVLENLKYSILIKEDFDNIERYYTNKNGRVQMQTVVKKTEEEIWIKDYASDKISKIKRVEVTELTPAELGAILWRNLATGTDYAEIAFSLPRLPFNMSYLLD